MYLFTYLALLDLGADINIRDFRLRSALLTACLHAESVECVRVLLDHNADITATDEDGDNCVQFSSNEYSLFLFLFDIIIISLSRGAH